MTSLLWKGFFKPLELTDLGNLAENDTSRYHYDQFLFIYQSFKVKKSLLWKKNLLSYNAIWWMFLASCPLL